MRNYHLLLAAISIICLNSGCEDWLKYEVNQLCTENETKCSGGNIYTCDENSRWRKSPTTECGALGCSEGTIQPASSPLQCYACGSDESKCEGDKLKTCVNHTWVENTCEYGCNADQCNECKQNEAKCEDGYIYTCTDGKWNEASKNTCEFGCINGLRADDGSVTCNECQENDMSCNGDAQPATIKKCMGSRWRDFEICEFGCAKADDNNYQCNDCNKDDYSNNPQNFCVKKVCTNHKYEKEETFEVSCNEERTDKGECLNGSAQCLDSGNDNGTFQFCLNGKWNSFGSCNPNNECSSLNGKTCAEFSSIGYTCNDQKLKACPNNASCKSDGSGCAACTNGATKCEDGNILECKNGEYQTTACGTGKHCEVLNDQAQCVAHICENGQQKCENNDIYECQNYQWKLKSACTGNDKCIENNDTNTASCGCTSGNAYCDGSTAKTCVNSQWKNTSCSNGKICTVNANEAKCVDCTAGQTKCSEDNKSIRSCTNGGSWAAATSCSDGMTCTGNAGNATCVCTDGQAKCDGSDNTKIYKCKDGKYSDSETCDGNKKCKGVAGSAVCTNNTECSPGTKQCDGNKLKTCKPNGKWESQTCEKGCSNMACNECNEGEYGSGQENNHEIAINCVNHKLIYTDCYPNLVEEREDLKKAICKGYCDVDNVQCEGAGQARYRCTTQNPFPNDPAYEPEGAPFYVEDGTCECKDPGVETRCYYENGQQDVLQICNDDGEWDKETQQKCYLCDDKTKTCYPECYPPKTTQCDGDNLQTCNADGKWEEQACEYGCNIGRCLSPVVQCHYDKNNITSITFDYDGITYSICNTPKICNKLSIFCSQCKDNNNQICHVDILPSNSLAVPKAFTFSCEKGSYSVSKQCNSNKCDSSKKNCPNIDGITPITPPIQED